VCLVNAAMLSIKAKCKWFRSQQAAAWSSSNKLTPRGGQEYKEVFKGVNYRDFTMNIVDRGNNWWEISVLRNVVGGRQSDTVTIPKEPTKGLYFGRCTCGLAQRDAILCKHMAAVVVSSQIPVLSQTNIMLFWWTHAHWQEQLGKDVLRNALQTWSLSGRNLSQMIKTATVQHGVLPASWSSSQEQMQEIRFGTSQGKEE
jgi:hypothetical protein